MRVIFAGTPEFARVAVAGLHAAGFELALVLTQPDRPAGRGLRLQASPVKQWAQAHDVPLAQPRSLRLEGKYPEDAAAARQAIVSAQADVMVVAAYGLILPQWVLDTVRCLNIHASLLPRWRGAAPIHRAIEAGDLETGVTIMQMDAGLDTGDILLMEKLSIQLQDSTGTLHDRLADLGASSIVRALELAKRGELRATPQPVVGVTYAQKIEKSEAQTDWSQSGHAIARRIRAFNPAPGAFSLLGGETLKFWEAEVLSDIVLPIGAVAGQIAAVGPAGIDVCTADSLVRITKLQKAGGKALAVQDFLRGFTIAPGMAFEPSPSSL